MTATTDTSHDRDDSSSSSSRSSSHRRHHPDNRDTSNDASNSIQRQRDRRSSGAGPWWWQRRAVVKSVTGGIVPVVVTTAFLGPGGGVTLTAWLAVRGRFRAPHDPTRRHGQWWRRLRPGVIADHGSFGLLIGAAMGVFEACVWPASTSPPWSLVLEAVTRHATAYSLLTICFSPEFPVVTSYLAIRWLGFSWGFPLCVFLGARRPTTRQKPQGPKSSKPAAAA